MEVTSVDYKINFLAGFKDGELRADAANHRSGAQNLLITV